MSITLQGRKHRGSLVLRVEKLPTCDKPGAQFLFLLYSMHKTETVLAAEPLLEFRMSTAIWDQFLSEGSNKGEARKASQLQ